MPRIVYEIVRSRVPTDREEEMLRLRPVMIAAVRRRFPELIDARLVKLDDGSWLDIARWESREAAERAAQAFPEIPEAAAMGELIEEVVALEHGVDAEPDGQAA